jgi:hypothetical protein
MFLKVILFGVSVVCMNPMQAFAAGKIRLGSPGTGGSFHPTDGHIMIEKAWLDRGLCVPWFCDIRTYY